MSCTFCDGEMWTEIQARGPSDEPPRQMHNIPVCIYCLEQFQERIEA